MTVVRQYKADLWIGGGLCAFCAFAAWRTLNIKQVVSPTMAGPSFVPWLMVVVIAVLALCLIFRGLRRAQMAGAGRSMSLPDRRSLLRIAAFVVLLVGYAGAFYPVGYIPSTLVAFVIGLWLIGERKIWVLVGFPVVMTCAVYFGFTELLSVWLP
ncbi:tripartite tricarboxylate transporter TctB family protein [Roseibium sp. CAU 1637]|uniref:Tripartite tricarboxylate transporter TctB family protein n=1 Tax=Roseibium limicola TaxID=2816037 RepID=A0A939EPE0_9HYPH|nr:tripartite tricarboxylate transporter TctB family protein [Roseibium limicola]MBO0346316.1 tripartite tricarboxylate transporter TctB family protein [Roseibium limicola]